MEKKMEKEKNMIFMENLNLKVNIQMAKEMEKEKNIQFSPIPFFQNLYFLVIRPLINFEKN